MCYKWITEVGLCVVTSVNFLFSSVVRFLSKCQNPDGGYGGGPGQISHLAPTYAAVNCLCIIGTNEAFQSINR